MSALRGVGVAALLASLWPSAAQQAGQQRTEGNPTVPLKECTNAGGCTSRPAKLVLDANWRWIHSADGYTNCYTGNSWNRGLCPDPKTCAQTCALEAVTENEYLNTYGVSPVPNGVRLKFMTQHAYGTNVGSRLYVMNGEDKYYMFQLKNREFSLDIDVSSLTCGLNGALYFIEMDESGGKGVGDNDAGAKYGTGYCDAQCPHDIKFIDGQANILGWMPNVNDNSLNMGKGYYGTCCAELDIWEANSRSMAYTSHPCTMETPGQLRCEGTACGDGEEERYDGVCDKDGCDLNPFRLNNRTFYGRGPSYTIDSTKPITVVTQFLTADGTDTGTLSEIRRFYVQEGRTVHSPTVTIPGADAADSITDDFCRDSKGFFVDLNDHEAKGGLAKMGQSLDRGHVLALSLWDDVEVGMMWLDSAYPPGRNATDPGVQRGDCPGGETSSSSYLRQNQPNAWVSFANIAIGEIGSTLKPSQ